MLTESEEFFVVKVTEGIIVLDAENGTCFNTKTNRFVGATSSTGRYPKYSMAENGRNSRIHHIQLHRLIWICNHGPIPDSLEVNHKDGDKENYRLKNLELLTPTGNVRHAWNNGLYTAQFGVNNGNAKFDEKAIAYIRNSHLAGKSINELAKEMNCARQTISGVINGRTYTNGVST